ncbi:hypothetical protein [Pseudooceanicola atlanticus]|uniref:Uncharacterized protein n=1 Tax=Pseudooceanicola atlanticus TaxID=1461694 RepID=A0A0A0EJR7_9RHOB|nr:hypothetical protein [Pseudooceanicola atlanticus]KGM50634.1 hypothetical protein ATO9_03910 [Pseudooceanicola atlanticus]
MTTATLTGSTVRLTLHTWSETFPLELLPSRIALYRGLRDRDGGAYAAIYEPTVAALEDLEQGDSKSVGTSGEKPQVEG